MKLNLLIGKFSFGIPKSSKMKGNIDTNWLNHIPAGNYLLKVNNRKLGQGKKYVQS